MCNSTGVNKMSKKNKNKEIEYSKEAEDELNRIEAEKQEDEHIKLQKLYDEYNARMQNRQSAGEALTIKPFEQWIRKAKKTNEHGNLIEVEVAGDTGETKSEKFRRLAVKRMEKTLTALDTVMNLSSNVYESTFEEQAQIVNALRLKVLDIENSFKVQEKKENLFDFEV